MSTLKSKRSYLWGFSGEKKYDYSIFLAQKPSQKEVKRTQPQAKSHAPVDGLPEHPTHRTRAVKPGLPTFPFLLKTGTSGVLDLCGTTGLPRCIKMKIFPMLSPGILENRSGRSRLNCSSRVH